MLTGPVAPGSISLHQQGSDTTSHTSCKLSRVPGHASASTAVLKRCRLLCINYTCRVDKHDNGIQEHGREPEPLTPRNYAAPASALPVARLCPSIPAHGVSAAEPPARAPQSPLSDSRGLRLARPSATIAGHTRSPRVGTEQPKTCRRATGREARSSAASPVVASHTTPPGRSTAIAGVLSQTDRRSEYRWSRLPRIWEVPKRAVAVLASKGDRQGCARGVVACLG